MVDATGKAGEVSSIGGVAEGLAAVTTMDMEADGSLATVAVSVAGINGVGAVPAAMVLAAAREVLVSEVVPAVMVSGAADMAVAGMAAVNS